MKAGWKTVKLSEIALIGAGNSAPQEKDDFSEDGPLFVRTSDVGEVKFGTVVSARDRLSPRGAKGMRLWKSGTILIPKSGASTFVNHRVILGTDAHVSSHLATIAADTAKVDPRFLLYYLSTVRAQDLIQDQSYPSLKLPEIGSIEIPLPPLAEQKRIVALLDEAFAGIDEAKAKAELSIQDAEILFESYLQSVFQDHEQGWVQKRLGDLVTRLTNGYVGPTRNIYQESGVPYLLARHVKNNRLNFDGRTFISQEFNLKNKKSLLKTGDVLLVQSGHIGHCAVVTDEHDGHNCHAMIVITATKGSFIGPFLSLFFNSSGMKRKFEQIRSGSTVPHLTCGEIRELMIPLPTFEIQKSIVDRANVLDECILQLRSSLANRLSAYDELKKSLLIQAFAGALTA